ncbi:hypothetical protein [Levilactobacillus namurensis]|uniref:hypothetical protein n=1 Tax=Levilactobacillus namurensis TaxID=380393 RepID=UPI002231D84E|nr:hypothetical protein [Levilactobacillus namurensis]MCW3779623.1 hypothetical protein [Levilactobacillus namurensis]MDT7018159.1 hypothetical protein [Levilactobacillus namurensis]WNN64853.1 hypothetical protein RIN67_09110 [Levilactobacillus namurensis]
MINYIARWNINDEKSTWSGTTYSLYEALKKYTNVNRIDAPQENFLQKVRLKLMRTNNHFDIKTLNRESNWQIVKFKLNI